MFYWKSFLLTRDFILVYYHLKEKNNKNLKKQSFYQLISVDLPCRFSLVLHSFSYFDLHPFRVYDTHPSFDLWNILSWYVTLKNDQGSLRTSSLLSSSTPRWVRMVPRDLRTVILWGSGGVCELDRPSDESVHHPRPEIGHTSGLPNLTLINVPRVGPCG